MTTHLCLQYLSPDRIPCTGRLVLTDIIIHVTSPRATAEYREMHSINLILMYVWCEHGMHSHMHNRRPPTELEVLLFASQLRVCTINR